MNEHTGGPYGAGPTPESERVDGWPGTVPLDEVVQGQVIRRIQAENERLAEDLALYGNAYTVSGKRVPPEDVMTFTATAGELQSAVADHVCDPDIDHDHDPVSQTVDNLKNELCKGIETTIRGQDEFLTMLDELLDDTLHDDHCYIHPNDTECVCIIGVIRAVLPPCGAVVDKGNGVYWKCVRNAHPASPERHVF